MPEKHRCQPPVDTSCCGPGLLHATEPRGTLWECHCGKLWRVGRDIQFGDAWLRAGWLARRRYQRQTVKPARSTEAGHSPSTDFAEETLGRLAGNGPLAAALYRSYMEGQERRSREPEPDDADTLEPLETSPLHAHEITPDDAALIRALSGAQVGPNSTVTLPSGKTITGAEMRRWIDNQDH